MVRAIIPWRICRRGVIRRLRLSGGIRRTTATRRALRRLRVMFIGDGECGREAYAESGRGAGCGGGSLRLGGVLRIFLAMLMGCVCGNGSGDGVRTGKA